MPEIPGTRLHYPQRNTGRQSLDAPPPPEPDRTLMDILTRSSGQTASAVALAIQAAGYTRPQAVHNWADLVDHPPHSVLTDKDQLPWTADAIPEQAWERNAPWHLVYTPQVPDIPNR